MSNSRIFGGNSDQVLSDIRSVYTNDISRLPIDPDIMEFPFAKIQYKLRGTTKDMTVDDEYVENLLELQKEDALTFSILSLLYPNLDFKNGNFHIDHIHPLDSFKVKKLNELGIKEEENPDFFDKEKYNSILNLQLLDSNENESKSNSELANWVEEERAKQNVSVEKFCENHLIPNILEFDKFPRFIEERSAILKSKIKSLIN